jgi:hypothetical protein
LITYTATNTKTGQFYIGSALNYCRYMARMGTHHDLKPGSRGYTQFQQDLQSDPLAFKWEWSEDDTDNRGWEKTLIKLYEGSPFLYNQGEGNSLPMGGQRALEGDFYPLACNPCISGHNKRGNLPKFLR